MSAVPASMLTASEAAQRLGARGQQRLRQLIQEGSLQGYKFPDGSPGFSLGDLDALTKPMATAEVLAALDCQEPAIAEKVSAGPTIGIRAIFEKVEAIAQWLAVNPKWATAKRIHDLFGVDRRWLLELVGRGLVKKAKKGLSQQALTLYRVEDVDRHLESVADGRVEA